MTRTYITGWLWFAVVQLIALLATVIGWILLAPPAALQCWKTRESMYFPTKQIPVWRGGWLTWIWGNEEDGVIGNAAHQMRYRKNPRLGAYLWSAWRNSANNLRFVFRWQGGPFCRREFRGWYVQAGWYPNGFPVLSAGRI